MTAIDGSNRLCTLRAIAAFVAAVLFVKVLIAILLEYRCMKFAKFQELTRKLYVAGVPLLVGTDTPEPQVTPGFSLHQELEMLVESGVPPAAALRAATLNNATVLRQEKLLGTLAPGKWADIVLLTANPLDDIRNTRQIELVIRGGLVTRPDDVLQLVPRD
ncbi:MAG TPA: amidohydrolase family protein [Pirellulaceae bacterium]|nr:amidohydrolase family protein [Pirellulaceae bacterium]